MNLTYWFGKINSQNGRKIEKVRGYVEVRCLEIFSMF